ncbi:hypothetical protein SCRM01_259 [Synechococcus phage S-CRM01]|uniref:hypothetical protein n=1 Tax=Synechococcus phage S-CRM01 TaxID=1026955 RepID=UPI000209E454|nr:hypothetical protein SCRM01_259 [Synechococcus phage S-CRM01]AEC53205.1 hypothetical protein SCRM01_259 [Synechococcus phage S-CRM01]
MSYTAQGTIEIDMADFTRWVYENYLPARGVEFQLGVPRVNKSNETMEIDFAMATDCNPREWVVKPDVCRQWNELK